MQYRPVLLCVAALWIPIAGAGVALAENVSDRPPSEAGDADESSGEAQDAPPEIFERVRVAGTPDKVKTIPGSVTYIDKETLEQQQYSDVHRILSLVPGVNIQEEDGYGLRPNIGIRGSGSERSSKITTMEDGVLIAPAPYAAPSAYYFPTVGRAEGVEVRKGSSSVQHGPFTNGGVINFLSSGIPAEFGGKLNLALGQNETIRGHLKVGDAGARFGWLVETYQHGTDGFKRLDSGGRTGFDLHDYMVKLRYTSGPGASMFQALELKLGTTLQTGNETYLGLTQQDFETDPYRRYAASQQDLIDTDHDQLIARYVIKPSRKIDFTAVAYRNDFFRNWRKLQSVGGQNLGAVLDDPLTYAAELAILRGDLAGDSADDALIVRNNRRDYYSQGIQTVLGIRPGGSDSIHELEIGLRYHQDEEDRFQEEDDFRMTANGVMELTGTGAPGSQANRVSRGESLSLFVKDTVSRGRWIVTPGVRFETIDFERTDYADAGRGTVSGERRNGVDEIIPGIGASFRLNEASNLFGGIHRGFAPPGPGATDANAEESINYEFGYRRSGDSLNTEFVAFYNDYDNLLGACTVSSGCSDGLVGDIFDGGQVEVYGLEAVVRYNLGEAFRSKHDIPISLTYTYTQGEFLNSFQSDYDPWGDVVAGDELPYVPEHQGSLGIGLNETRWAAFANLIYVDAMRSVAGQGGIPQNESTESHFLIDLSGEYIWNSKLRLFAQIRNATDRAYVAARRPAGVRPGINRTALVGVVYSF